MYIYIFSVLFNYLIWDNQTITWFPNKTCTHTHKDTHAHCVALLPPDHSPRCLHAPGALRRPAVLASARSSPASPYLPPAIICILYLCRPASCLMSLDHMAMLWEHFQTQLFTLSALNHGDRDTKLTACGFENGQIGMFALLAKALFSG